MTEVIADIFVRSHEIMAPPFGHVSIHVDKMIANVLPLRLFRIDEEIRNDLLVLEWHVNSGNSTAGPVCDGVGVEVDDAYRNHQFDLAMNPSYEDSQKHHDQ